MSPFFVEDVEDQDVGARPGGDREAVGLRLLELRKRHVDPTTIGGAQKQAHASQPARVEDDVFSVWRPRGVVVTRGVIRQRRRSSRRQFDQPDIALSPFGRVTRLGKGQLLTVRAQIEIAARKSWVANGSHRSSAAVQPGQLRFRFRRRQEHESAVRGDREPAIPRHVTSDLCSKGHGIAFQPERFLIEGLRHQVPATREEQVSRGVGDG